MLIRIHLIVVLLASLGCQPARIRPQAPALPQPRPLSARVAVTLIPWESAVHAPRGGRVELLAAFKLEGKHPGFGGFSAVTVLEDKLLLLSDGGRWFSARRKLASDGKLIALSGWRVEPVLDLSGWPVQPPLHDSESLTRTPDGLLVGFEWRHRLWLYRKGRQRAPEPLPVPAELSGAPYNGGLEAITRLADGRLLLLCEEYQHGDGTRRGWIGGPGAWRSLSYVVEDGWAPTSVGLLPSGDLVVLERRYRPKNDLRVRLRRVPGATVKAGARLTPVEELIRIETPLARHNFEGLTVEQHAASGSTLLYLVSDNNFVPGEASLIFQLRLKRVAEGGAAAARKPR